ncbi:hypothetical protein C8Q74DRAFT_663961 [Fomes fomentarius]|nr:hypothetical protein C8Q74DRAFT_663961 [Fomes fomentarius]
MQDSFVLQQQRRTYGPPMPTRGIMAEFFSRFIIPTFAGFKHVTWLVSTGSTMAVSADLLLTVTLIHLLRRSRTGMKSTDSMLEVMILYSINTGLLTGILNLLSLFFAFICPGDLIYIGIGIPCVKLYANTLLAALNSRKSLKDKCAGLFVEVSPFGDGFGMTPEVPVSLGRDSERVSPRQLRMTLYAMNPSAATESVELEVSVKKDLVRDTAVEDNSRDLEGSDQNPLCVVSTHRLLCSVQRCNMPQNSTTQHKTIGRTSYYRGRGRRPRTEGSYEHIDQ